MKIKCNYIDGLKLELYSPRAHRVNLRFVTSWPSDFEMALPPLNHHVIITLVFKLNIIILLYGGNNCFHFIVL